MVDALHISLLVSRALIHSSFNSAVDTESNIKYAIRVLTEMCQSRRKTHYFGCFHTVKDFDFEIRCLYSIIIVLLVISSYIGK